MPIKSYRPTTPTRRFQTSVLRDEITRQQPEKSLVQGKSEFGRAQQHGFDLDLVPRRRPQAALPGGRFQARQDRRAGQRWRRSNTTPTARPTWRCCTTLDGEKRYILQPAGLKVGMKIMSGPEADILVGNALPLKNIPPGTLVHNVELKPGKGGQMARAAGSDVRLISKEGGYALLKLPSGEVRRVLVDCMATIGQVGNVDHSNISLGKAGRKRWMGKRPHNRGVSMNPVDHPHGGGEGKTSGGRNPVTPWGQPTRGYKTRNNRRTDQFIVARRGQKKTQ